MGLYSNEVTLPLINTEIAMALFSHLPYSLNNNSNIFYKYLFPKIYKNLQRCSRVQVPLFVCCFVPEENNTALKIELKLFPAIVKPCTFLGTTSVSAIRWGQEKAPPQDAKL